MFMMGTTTTQGASAETADCNCPDACDRDHDNE